MGEYVPPRHIVAVSGYVANPQGHVLLVRTVTRKDTWEIPGGQVEEGEPLDQAVRRELVEETGIDVEPVGITGVYYNQTLSLVSVVFVCRLISGEPRPQPEEILDVRFVDLNETNIGEYIRRPHMRSRTLDAMKQRAMIPCETCETCETWETQPYRLIQRLEPNPKPDDEGGPS